MGLPSLCSRILHLPSLPCPVEVVSPLPAPRREGCAGWPQQQEPRREVGGHNTGVAMEKNEKHLGFSVPVIRDHGATALSLGGRTIWELQTVRPLREPPRVQLAQTQHCDGLDLAGPLPAQRSDKHNLSVLRPRSPAPVSN